MLGRGRTAEVLPIGRKKCLGARVYRPSVDRWYTIPEAQPMSLLEAEEPTFWLLYEKAIVVYRLCPWRVEMTHWWTFRRTNSSRSAWKSQLGVIAMALRKVTNAPAAHTEISDSAGSKRWPELWQHLTLRHYDTAKTEPRHTSTITLFRRDDGLLGATLNDRDNSRVCFAAGQTILGLMDTLEAVASNPDTAWREDKNLTGASRRKK